MKYIIILLNLVITFNLILTYRYHLPHKSHLLKIVNPPKNKFGNIYEKIYERCKRDKILFVAMGNKGEKYARNWHNVGWMFMDYALSKFEPPQKYKLHDKLNS